MRITILLFVIILSLYILDVRLVVAMVDGFSVHWNNATIYLTTFKDRHPWIMLFMPYMVIVLLYTMKDTDHA